MSVACRVPLRAFANPATVIGQTAKPLISGASFHTVTNRSPVSRAVTCQTRKFSKHEYNSFSASWRRCYVSSQAKDKLNAGKNPGNKGQSSGPGPLQRKPVRFLVVLALLGAGALVFSDEIQHAYRAAVRSSRVVGTLAVCINE